MERFVQSVFLGEIETQCEFVLLAAQDLDRALGEPNSSANRIWYPVQTILVSAANISKLLWGSSIDPEERKRIEADRQQLRRRIRVRKTSPLYSRRLRNAFEHIDEDLETLQKQNPNESYVGRNIGPHSSVSAPGSRRFGHFDDRTGLVTFLGASANIRRLIDEVARIYPLVQTEFFKPV